MTDFGQMAADHWNARRHRDSVLGSHFAGEAGWDMLLYIYAANSADRRVSISAATSAAGVPHTTALRALHIIIDDGLVMRVPDRRDGRRTFLELTRHGSVQVEQALFRPSLCAAGRVDRTPDGRFVMRLSSRQCEALAPPLSEQPDAVTLLRQALAILT